MRQWPCGSFASAVVRLCRTAESETECCEKSQAKDEPADEDVRLKPNLRGVWTVVCVGNVNDEKGLGTARNVAAESDCARRISGRCAICAKTMSALIALRKR